jgi:hypothetical protein
MNEAGLYIEEMTLDGTRFPEDHSKPLIFMVQWMQYEQRGDGACNCVNDRKPGCCVLVCMGNKKKWPVGQKVNVVLIKQGAALTYRIPTTSYLHCKQSLSAGSKLAPPL